ncbi:C10 family peptidase [uncultured Alistipes sp.]|uniref:C10 family peptidase n=1 Tax=uncultured Alistipes sp. TaxID=538949 RepID=UPI002638F032|nr:C10 family peptidase [uncultured Alistipes sp.]
MKRLFLLFSAWVFFLSCTRDADENFVLSSQVPEPVSPYAVPESEALQSLAVALQQIDGSDETRAGGVRKPLSIRTVKASDVFETTRSADIPDLENLFYVVSFGEGNGSAVLGADRRISSVFAILDETVLTSEDLFRTDATRAAGLEEDDPERDIRIYLTNLIKEAGVRNLLANRSQPPALLVSTTYRDSILNRTFCKPMVKTKWKQVDPYNKFCPPKYWSDGNCPAGCGPIAFAQLMVALPYPDPLIVEGIGFDRNVLMQNVDEAAWFCRVVGIPLRTTYTDEESPTFAEDIAETMRNLGWSEAGLVEYNYYNAYITVYLQRKPFYLRGETATKKTHGWLVDGWDSYIRQRWETKHYSQIMPGAKDIETMLSEESVNLVHCNFGWGGKCDGYYAHHVFDTTRPLDFDFVDKEAGDIVWVEDCLLDRQFFMIGY